MLLQHLKETLATGDTSYAQPANQPTKFADEWKEQEGSHEQRDVAGSSASGTFAGVNFDAATLGALTSYMKAQGIPNPVPKEDLHTTLLYSRKNLPNYEPLAKYQSPYVATPTGLEIFQTRSGKNCLVIPLNSEDLHQRHADLMIDHDAEYDFDEYRPHVTLSYDAGDIKPEDFQPFDRPINIVGEYKEDLDED